MTTQKQRIARIRRAARGESWADMQARLRQRGPITWAIRFGYR